MAQTGTDTISRATELLRSGNKAETRRLLLTYLNTHPDSVQGWWLMSYAVESQEDQIECLQEVLTYSPNHTKAQKRLAALTGESVASADGNIIEKLTADLKKLHLPKNIVIAIIVVLSLALLFVGYFGYKALVLPPLPEVATLSLAQNPTSAPPTLTPTPKLSATPLVSNTPTPDPNLTPTLIPEDQIGLEIGQYPLDFTLINAINNREVNLRDFVGQPVILVFLNTQDSASEQEMPGLQAAYAQYQDQGLVVLGVGVGSSQSALRNFSGRFGGLTFTLMSDWEHEIAKQYGVNVLPTNIFIRKNGKIWQVSAGVLNEAELAGIASSLLKVP